MDSPLREAPRSVLVCYADDDAAAAQSIAEGLRRVGVDPCLERCTPADGGGPDPALVRRIEECALFLPVISPNAEGPSCIEWRLADLRARSASHGRPFIVPVALNGTPQRDAQVPASFHAVPWLRMSGGRCPPELGAHVASLLENDERSREPADGAAVVAAPAGVPQGTVRWIVICAAAIGLGLAAQSWRAGAGLPWARTGAPMLPPAAPDSAVSQYSLAVLPFVDTSEKKDQAYFGDGLSAELIDRLARVRELQIPARTSSFYFKNRADNAAAIARQLHVAYVLEGSAGQTGTALRVAVQLIRAETGQRVWAATYDRDLKEVFAVQDDIAKSVVLALKLKVAPRTPGGWGTSDTGAYEQFLMGQELQRRTPADWRGSVGPLRKAIVLDPGYGAAYAALAYSEANLADIDQDPGQLARAVADADKAVLLAPDQADGYQVRGYLRMYYTWEWNHALGDFDRAMELNAADVQNLSNSAAQLAILGRLPEAIGIARKAVQTDPLSIVAWVRLGRYLTANAQYAAADAALRRAQSLQADNSYALIELGTLRLVEDNAGEALAAFKRIGANGQRSTEIAMAEYSLGAVATSERELDAAIALHATTLAYRIAQAYAWCGQSNNAFEWLERSYKQHDPEIAYLKYDPLIDRIRHDPRYTALLHALKLPE